MKTVGIFYGTNGGKTQEVVDIVAKHLGDAQLFDVADGIDAIEMFDNIILASPTYGLGDLQDDWANVIDELGDIDFNGKTVALIGVGDSALFGANFVESMLHFYNALEGKGANLIGFTSVDGYEFESSEAVIEDKFMGLAIDASFDEDEIDSKVESWVERLKEDLQ